MGIAKTLVVVRVFLVITFLVLFARLIELQVIKGEYYKSLADGNRIRRVVLEAPRGTIHARGGELLVNNISADKGLYYDPKRGYFTSDQKPSEGVLISNLPLWRRDYPLKEAASHITGYIQPVNEKEVKTTNSSCIEKGERTPFDYIGRSGLEEYYDCFLRGFDGEMLVEVNADGSFVRELGKKPPTKGTDLKTTIDYPLQEYVSTLLNGVKGAIIVSDPDGEIYAMYSSPSYDPNLFIEGSKKLSGILESKDLPLFNRAISGKYSPGSIYKPILSAIALQTGSIDRNYRYVDTGSIKFDTAYGGYSFANWYFTQYGGTEGSIDVTRALARSTDTFFYKVGELTGIGNIVEWSKKFGLDSLSGIDLPGEVEGLVPDPAWKEEVKGERWFLGNTYHLSIGQGDLLVTPMGIHSAITSIAFGGKLCKPHLNSEIKNGDFYDCRDLGISEANINLIKEGMRKACTTGGTGYPLFDFKEKSGVSVACKTGTAQLGVKDKTHAWFTAFAPVDKPEIVVTVLVEEGGEGSKVAGPIARQIFDFWFKK